MEKELEVALRKFNSAKEKMEARAKGRYTAVSVEQILYSDGSNEVRCVVYREDIGGGYGNTWEEALKDFEARI